MKLNYYTAIVILLVVGAAISSVTLAVKTVNVSDLPPELQYIWQGLIYVLQTSAIAPLFTIIRNIYGYFINKYQGKPNTNIEYDANMMLSTWLTYEEYIKGAGVFSVIALQNTPWSQYAVYIAGAAAFIIDLVRKSLYDIAHPTTPTPPAA